MKLSEINKRIKHPVFHGAFNDLKFEGTFDKTIFYADKNAVFPFWS